MAGSINKVTLIGNVGNEPEIRQTQDGRELANLSIATSDSWRDKNTGERREKTEWHRVVVFNEGLVKVIKNYVHKGSKLYLEGALQTRKWTGNDGIEKYTTEVVLQGFNGNLTMLDSKGSQGGSYNQDSGSQNQGQQQASPAFGQVPGGNASNAPAAAPELDDEIPF
ncbi:MAG: single-stranded DNA-binding protein [Rickettsiales bacterium]|nr:single-stranded DNA-binding protein [Rickettsiales bacterium]